jgi:hypothetical protein
MCVQVSRRVSRVGSINAQRSSQREKRVGRKRTEGRFYMCESRADRAEQSRAAERSPRREGAILLSRTQVRCVCVLCASVRVHHAIRASLVGSLLVKRSSESPFPRTTHLAINTPYTTAVHLASSLPLLSTPELLKKRDRSLGANVAYRSPLQP